MKLTRTEAIDKSIEEWEHLKRTGTGGHIFAGERPANGCYLCEYTKKRWPCLQCPYFMKYEHDCLKSEPFNKWGDAKTPRTRKKYAALFLEELKALK